MVAFRLEGAPESPGGPIHAAAVPAQCPNALVQ